MNEAVSEAATEKTWQPPQNWVPLERASINRDSQKTTRAAMIQRWKNDPAFRAAMPEGVTLRDVLIKLREEFAEAADNIWMNDLYQVIIKAVAFAGQPGWHLSIKRLDKKPITDWRHRQWIKNQLLGPEVEAVELYPAESRLVDTANQYHLWAYQEPGYKFPFGFPAGFKMEGSLGNSEQRDFDEV